MLDVTSENKEIYSKAGIAYIAFISDNILPLPSGEKSPDKTHATIIFQVNLRTVTFYGKQANRFEDIPKTHTAYRDAVESRIATIISRITELTRAHDQEYKYLVFGDPVLDEEDALSLNASNNVRFRRPYTLRVEDLTTFFKGTLTLVEEYYGVPADLESSWTSLYGTAFEVLAGCSISEAVEAKTGINKSTVNTVLNELKNILVNTTVQAVQFGAYSMDYFVPPLGIFKVRPNFNPRSLPLDIEFEPDRRMQMEMASALGFEFNTYNNMSVAATVAAYKQKGKSENGTQKKQKRRRS